MIEEPTRAAASQRQADHQQAEAAHPGEGFGGVAKGPAQAVPFSPKTHKQQWGA